MIVIQTLSLYSWAMSLYINESFWYLVVKQLYMQPPVDVPCFILCQLFNVSFRPLFCYHIVVLKSVPCCCPSLPWCCWRTWRFPSPSLWRQSQKNTWTCGPGSLNPKFKTREPLESESKLSGSNQKIFKASHLSYQNLIYLMDLFISLMKNMKKKKILPIICQAHIVYCLYKNSISCA